MAEYIDREETKAWITDWLRNDKYWNPYSKGKNIPTTEVFDVLSRIPSADVQPVVHGRWIKARGSWCTPGGDPVWECSECGKGMHVYGIEHGTYGSDVADGQWVACPNCGARMDGET